MQYVHVHVHCVYMLYIHVHVNMFYIVFPESYAPFQSMAERESFLTVDSQLATAPGPAHYTPTHESHVKGGDTLQSRVCIYCPENVHTYTCTCTNAYTLLMHVYTTMYMYIHCKSIYNMYAVFSIHVFLIVNL